MAGVKQNTALYWPILVKVCQVYFQKRVPKEEIINKIYWKHSANQAAYVQ